MVSNEIKRIVALEWQVEMLVTVVEALAATAGVTDTPQWEMCERWLIDQLRAYLFWGAVIALAWWSILTK